MDTFRHRLPTLRLGSEGQDCGLGDPTGSGLLLISQGALLVSGFSVHCLGIILGTHTVHPEVL